MQAGGRRFDPVILHHYGKSSNVSHLKLGRFRFGLFEITVFSFFNNLEEVKFYVVPRQWRGRVALCINKQATTLYFLNSVTLFDRQDQRLTL